MLSIHSSEQVERFLEISDRRPVGAGELKSQLQQCAATVTMLAKERVPGSFGFGSVDIDQQRRQELGVGPRVPKVAGVDIDERVTVMVRPHKARTGSGEVSKGGPVGIDLPRYGHTSSFLRVVGIAPDLPRLSDTFAIHRIGWPDVNRNRVVLEQRVGVTEYEAPTTVLRSGRGEFSLVAEVWDMHREGINARFEGLLDKPFFHAD